MMFAVISLSIIGSVCSLYKAGWNQQYVEKYKLNLKHKLRLELTACAVEDGPTNHGGPILTGNMDLYNIFIGYSDDDYKTPYYADKPTSTVGILEAFAKGVGGSGYANILKSYTRSGDVSASQFTFKGNVFINIPSSIKSFTDASLDSYVIGGLTAAGYMPLNAQNSYSVIFRGDISYKSTRSGEGSWNIEWCGYHSTFLSNSLATISIMGDEMFVGNAKQRSGCMLQFVNTQNVKYIGDSHPRAFTSPNGNPYADAIVSVYSHELSEVVTDPYYYNPAYYKECIGKDNGMENADICAWVFGNVYKSGDVHYNLDLGVNGKYLIQGNWILRSLGNSQKSGCVITNSTFATPLNEYPVYKVDTDTQSLFDMLLGNKMLLGLSIAGGVLILLLCLALVYQCLRVKSKRKGDSDLTHSRVYLNDPTAQFANVNPYAGSPIVHATRVPHSPRQYPLMV